MVKREELMIIALVTLLFELDVIGVAYITLAVMLTGAAIEVIVGCVAMAWAAWKVR